jgi:hypothetical protein
MPFGSPSDIHVNRVLTNVAINYMQDTSKFVAAKIFPHVNVSKQSDLYYIFNRGDSNRSDFQMRAPATESAGVTLQISTSPYFAKKWALHYDVADEIRANADDAFNLDRMATMNLMFKGMLKQELTFVDAFFKAGVWARDITGVGASVSGSSQTLQWNDVNSDPIDTIRDACTDMQMRTGYRPNTLTLGQQVKDRLIRHPSIIDLIKYSSSNDNPAIVNDGALAKVFDVDRVLTMGAVVNSGKEGLAETNSFIGGKSALLTYSPASASLTEPSAGYTFDWTGYLGNSPSGIRMKSFRMEKIEADRIEAEMFYDQKITANDLGVFFPNIVA